MGLVRYITAKTITLRFIRKPEDTAVTANVTQEATSSIWNVTFLGAIFPEAVRNVGEIIGRDLSNRDEFDSGRRVSHSDEQCQHERGPVQVFEYPDLNGICRFKVHRQDCIRCRKKWIWQTKPDGTRNLDGVEPIIFNWPAVDKADTVFIVEGEPKVLALAKWGLTATCNPGGAGKWSPDFNSELYGKKIIILPDNDKPGKQHAIDIACQLAERKGGSTL